MKKIAAVAICSLIALNAVFKLAAAATIGTDSTPGATRVKREKSFKAQSFIDLILSFMDSLQFIQQKTAAGAHTATSSSKK